MTDQEINVEIAEACGIKICNHPLVKSGKNKKDAKKSVMQLTTLSTRW